MLLCMAGVLTERERVKNLYLREENRILREQVGKRPRLTDDQRRRLASGNTIMPIARGRLQDEKSTAGDDGAKSGCQSMRDHLK